MQKCTLNVRSFFKLRNKYKHCQFDRKMDLFKVKRKKKKRREGECNINSTLYLVPLYSGLFSDNE